jgi:hypothetical protein
MVSFLNEISAAVLRPAERVRSRAIDFMEEATKNGS